MWTSATSSMPCGPGRAAVTASIVIAFQSVTASACTRAEKPSVAHATTPASFGSLNMLVLLIGWWVRLRAHVSDDRRAGVDLRHGTSGCVFGAAPNRVTEIQRQQLHVNGADAISGCL